jgi:5-methylcytosine-specific restriction protein A
VARGLIYPPAVAGNDTWRAVEATDPLRLAEECSPHDVLLEGARERVYVNRFERNREARARCIELLGASCVVCGFNFAETYGPIGLGCIHVHHLVPLATVTDAYVVDAAADLRPVCPNCHYMLHRRDPPFSIEELRAILAHQRSHASVPTGGEDGS